MTRSHVLVVLCLTLGASNGISVSIYHLDMQALFAWDLELARSYGPSLILKYVELFIVKRHHTASYGWQYPLCHSKKRACSQVRCWNVVAGHTRVRRELTKSTTVKEKTLLKHVVVSIFIGNTYSDQGSWLLGVHGSHIVRMSWKMEKYMKGILALGNNASGDFRLKR